jgi:hypothetical protein
MKKVIVYGAIVIAIPVLAFAYYAISPLFRVIKADDALPVATTQVDAAPAAVVTGTTGHPASGTVRVVTADGKSFVRYENFKTINGPDIYVYLSKDLDAKEFVNLGPVKATEGNVNYEIPAGTDISQYRYVLTWCKQFGVLFNSATLSS